jgi:leader peptidase (prepilin peptidase)/N-methyltransferase
MTLADIPLWYLRSVALLFGLLWGSFLNVVIYRVPRGMSVVNPPSHCPACGAKVRPFDNVPVLAYVWLRGRARCCKAPLSPRYPLVELLGGALSAAIVEGIVLALPPDTGAGTVVAVYLADLALALGLTAAAFIDAEHMFLPDGITIGGAVLGFVTAPLRGLGFASSLTGAAIGFLVVYGPFVVLYGRLRGRPGMGLGDAKLLLLAGAWFGWQGALFTLFAGAAQGTVGAAILLLAKGRIEEPEAVRRDREEILRAAEAGDEEAKRLIDEDPLAVAPGAGLGQARIPFGPFLILACLEYLFFGEAVERYFRGVYEA